MVCWLPRHLSSQRAQKTFSIIKFSSIAVGHKSGKRLPKRALKVPIPLENPRKPKSSARLFYYLLTILFDFIPGNALSSFSASLSLNCPMPQSQFRRQLHGLQMSGFCLTWKPARQLVFQKGLKFQPVVVLQNGKIATNKKKKWE